MDRNIDLVQIEQLEQHDKQSENNLNRCHHIAEIDILSDPKFQSPQFQQKLIQCSFKCSICVQKQSKQWLCLSQDCHFVGCQIKKNDHHLQHYSSKGHSVFINTNTLMIICIDCEIELFNYDHSQVGIIRDIFNKQKIVQLQYRQVGNEKQIGLINEGNSNFINTVLQILINNQPLNMVFQNYYKTFNSCYEDDQLQCLKIQQQLMYYIGKLCIERENNNHKRITEINGIIHQLNQETMSYEMKDAYEFYKFILNVIHDQLKILVHRNLEIQRNIQYQVEIVDEWELIHDINSYTDSSIVSDIYKGKLCNQTICTSCDHKILVEEDLMGISLVLQNQYFMQRLFTNYSLENLLHCFFQQQIQQNCEKCQ